MKLRFSSPAIADFREIALYYSTISSTLATRMTGRSKKRCRDLLRFPHIGRLIDTERFGDQRRIVVSPYIVVYRVRDRTVEILRVLHGARDIDPMIAAIREAPPEGDH